MNGGALAQSEPARPNCGERQLNFRPAHLSGGRPATIRPASRRKLAAKTRRSGQIIANLRFAGAARFAGRRARARGAHLGAIQGF